MEAFRDGIEEMLLLIELEKASAKSTYLTGLVEKYRAAYPIAERYDHAQNPHVFRKELLETLSTD